ncbi:MAG: ABC transporter ATP-binding protein [Acidobacteriota bacterium]
MSTSSSSRELLQFIRPQARRYGWAVVALAFSVAFALLTPMVTGILVDGLLRADAATDSGWAVHLERWPGGRDWWLDRLWLVGGLVVLLTGLSGLFSYVHRHRSAWATEDLILDLRRRLHRHLLRLPCKTIDGRDTGDVVQRCSSDLDTLRTFLSQGVVDLGRVLLMIVVAIPVMFVLHPLMTLVAVALLPLIGVFALSFFKRVQELFTEVDECEGRLTALLQEVLTGMRVVRSFGRGPHERQRFGEHAAEWRNLRVKLLDQLASYWSLSDFLCLAQIGLVLVVGGILVRSSALSVGGLVAFLSWAGLLVWPLRQAGRVLSESGQALVSLGRVDELLAEIRESELPEDEAGEVGPQGELVIEGLTFEYDEAGPALHELDLTVAAGETVALTGPPGSGKSTLVSLLLRLHDYETGTIRLDGRELRELPRRSVRRKVASVLQEPFLFSRSVGANLELGRDGVEHDELVEATRIAGVHGDIETLGEGYDTLVGERGVTLSGGQRQRLALARALLRDAPVLVLDDSLSAVDTETEARIREALRRRRGKATTILIAHRLSTLREADRVVVLDRGRKVQEGRHAELCSVPGPYRDSYEVQAQHDSELAADLVERGAAT